MTESDSIREKNADDEPTSPFLKSSRLISCRRDKLSLLECFIATKIPADIAIITNISVKINFPLFSFNVREQEKRNPFIKECDLYDFNIDNNIKNNDKKEHFSYNRYKVENYLTFLLARCKIQDRGDKMRLIGDIYDSNVFVEAIGGEKYIVDAGADFNKLKQVIKDKNVSALFLTHGHFDHSYFAMDYSENLDIKIYASDKIKEYLEDPKKNYSTDLDCEPMKVTDFSNFVLLHGDGKIVIGKMEVEYYQLGGHSKSDMCYLIGEDLYVGDLVIGRGIGRMDLYGGDKQEMIKSLKKLSALKYTTMHCGHGEDLTKNMADKVIATYLKFLSRN